MPETSGQNAHSLGGRVLENQLLLLRNPFGISLGLTEKKQASGRCGDMANAVYLDHLVAVLLSQRNVGRYFINQNLAIMYLILVQPGCGKGLMILDIF
jgi:hypothetical protein